MRVRFIIFCLTLVVIINSCSKQESCAKMNLDAIALMDKFDGTSNNKFLEEILSKGDLSYECTELNVVKVQAFYLLDMYEEGLAFVDSLNASSLPKKYQKSLFKAYFTYYINGEEQSALFVAKKEIEDYLNENSTEISAWMDYLRVQKTVAVSDEDYSLILDSLLQAVDYNELEYLIESEIKYLK